VPPAKTPDEISSNSIKIGASGKKRRASGQRAIAVPVDCSATGSLTGSAVPKNATTSSRQASSNDKRLLTLDTRCAGALHRRRFGSVPRSALERATAPITPSPNCASHFIRRALPVAQPRNAGRTCPIWRSPLAQFGDHARVLSKMCDWAVPPEKLNLKISL